ncbi:AraC family transcriptional regulator [Paenibacillus filicis]|uniref:AraC family transcriptional regulator n=1 Tax=Paenibacillus filicis TaxID=669464 RepID=A0ABU9DEJ2_9BACL
MNDSTRQPSMKRRSAPSAARWPLEQQLVQFVHIDFVRLDSCERVNLPHSGGGLNRLILTADGMGRLEIAGSCLEAERGTCCLAASDVPLAIVSNGETGMTFYVISFQAGAIAGLSSDKHDEDEQAARESIWCAQLSDRAVPPLLDWAKRLYTDRSGASTLERFRLNMTFQELVYGIMKDRSGRQADNAREAVWTTVQYMERHYMDPISRVMLAGMAGMSQEYYSRVFKRETGKTPSGYLTDIRMSHARRELVRGQSSVGDIAEDVGYEDLYYFSRKFKQAVGVPPTAYIQRKRHNKVACLYFPYLDHMLAVGHSPAATMIDKSHPLAERVRATVDLGSDEPEFGERHARLLSENEPDLILCSTYISPDQEQLLRRIAPAIQLPYDRDWRLALRDVAGFLDRDQEAEEAIARYENQVEEAGERIRRRLGSQTVALLRVHAEGLRLYGGPMGGYAGPVLYGDLQLSAPRLVRTRAWESKAILLTLESLPELDVDRLLLVVDPNALHQAAELVSHPGWLEIPAVRNGHVHEVGYFTWMSKGLEMNKLKIDEALGVLV